MMIAKNPLLRAVGIVTAFWYAVFLLVALVRGTVGLPEAGFALLQSVIVTLLMLLVGLIGTVMVRLGIARAVGEAVSAGDAASRLSVSLGGLPMHPWLDTSRPVIGKRDRVQRRFALPLFGKPAPSLLDTLHAQPWWPTIAHHAPAHAAAMDAVVRLMNTQPRLPASPVPNGHAGRTLFEHSLAVAAQMIVEQKTWAYEGQRDKKGRIREPLKGDQPHRFSTQELPLLILAGLAHDIGKLRCYEPVPDFRDDAAHTVPVREVKPNHDTEGAKLLRRIPEIMALPLADRTALLTAVGYYHHAFAIPRSGWVTDRVRSLTELLIRADIATGMKEGHAGMDYAEAPDEDEQPAAPVPQPLDDEPPEDEASAGAGVDPTVAAIMRDAMNAAISPTPAPAAVANRILANIRSEVDDEVGDDDLPVRPEPVPATPAPAPATPSPSGAVPRLRPTTLETTILLDMLSVPGAIGGHNEAIRIARRYGEQLFVMEPIFRKKVGFKRADLHDAIQEHNGNAAPFTVALLNELDAQGLLLREAHGYYYAASRAVFKATTKRGANLPPGFIIPVSAVPMAEHAPDEGGLILIEGLWGKHAARKIEAPQAAEPATWKLARVLLTTLTPEERASGVRPARNANGDPLLAIRADTPAEALLVALLEEAGLPASTAPATTVNGVSVRLLPCSQDDLPATGG